MVEAEMLRLVGERGASSPPPTVAAVIPTLNEEGSLPWVLANLPAWVGEVVLVDGLSTDRTESVARQIRPDAVVVHQHRKGKGAALRAGFAAATSDIIVMLDADGSTDPREMGRFVAALRQGADFVKGSRHLDGGGSEDFTRIRSAGNRAFVLMANLMYGCRFTDLCYGYCAFWRRSLEALALTADGFEIETQLVLGAARAGLEVREVPSFELPRRAGASNLNAVRDGIRVLRAMLEPHPLVPIRPEATRAAFQLHRVGVPVWETDRLTHEGERRGRDRRVCQYPHCAGPERRVAERRAVVGTAQVLRAVYPPAVELALAPAA